MFRNAALGPHHDATPKQFPSAAVGQHHDAAPGQYLGAASSQPYPRARSTPAPHQAHNDPTPYQVQPPFRIEPITSQHCLGALPGAQKQEIGPNCNFFAIGNCCEPSDRGPRYKTAGNPPLSGRFRFTRLKNEPLIAKKLQRCRNFCFHDGRIATTGTRPYEKRVKSPSKGKRAYPKSKKAKPHEPARLTGQTLRKRRVLATAAGQNPRNSHESQRGQEGPRKNHTTPSNGGGANLTKEGYKTRGLARQKRELQYRYGAQEKRPAEASAGLFRNEFAMRARDPTPRCSCSRTAWSQGHRR